VQWPAPTFPLTPVYSSTARLFWTFRLRLRAARLPMHCSLRRRRTGGVRYVKTLTSFSTFDVDDEGVLRPRADISFPSAF